MANIYLNEFDRFMKHTLKPLAYLRYGDDWLCFAVNKQQTELLQTQSKDFLLNELSFTVNPKIDHIQPAYKGISYLGVDIWPSGKRLQFAVRERLAARLDRQNIASYRALVAAHEKRQRQKAFDWQVLATEEELG